jgi:hypothetical protein
VGTDLTRRVPEGLPWLLLAMQQPCHFAHSFLNDPKTHEGTNPTSLGTFTTQAQGAAEAHAAVLQAFLAFTTKPAWLKLKHHLLPSLTLARAPSSSHFDQEVETEMTHPSPTPTTAHHGHPQQ